MSGDGDDRGKSADRNPGGDKKADDEPIDFHGAAIIDEDGHEIPITDEMIKDACKKLDPTTADETNDDA